MCRREGFAGRDRLCRHTGTFAAYGGAVLGIRGETSRPLDVRVKEHKNYVRDYQVDRSHLAKHVWDNGHQINWKQASIIQKEPNFGKRKLKESACIKLNGGVIPEQCHLMTVINLSSKTLNTSQKLILPKGLNFALTPKDVPTLDIITSIEETCQKLSEDVSNEFRIRSKLILEKPLKIKSNINKEEMLSLKQLKNDKYIKILPADKGNATVIMNTIDYNTKILNMITEEKLTTINLNPTDLLVSFDVVSLFTNVPVDKTLSIVKNKLENDSSFKYRTKLNVTAFMELLTLCIKTTYFQLENDFYQQDFGMAMGSSLSPIMSNIFMEYFEETYVKNYTNKPKIWWRYVDDVFSVWPHGQDSLTQFLNFLNNIEPTIKFTLELEENNKLPFLDVMVSKNVQETSNFQTNVYRKKTNTNRYLNFDSNHHLSVKKGIIKSLYDRAKLVSSNLNIFHQEKDHIKNILKENAYPEGFVEKTLLQIENPPNNNQNRQNPTSNMTIPYIPRISERLKTWK
ncbi:hypothetical protein NQ315_012834 [Exocentrus adspersus]|uniref:Reverse transcriptase domain-containing protein n=1 Tax=Exocentrus adspersus TaxID=1586481 RepID=A0AAV8V5R1_9CUCU|nr:hypothetical protein NQ315_012834 [Exocentrus adspersus]